jgi:hypothetical protein
MSFFGIQGLVLLAIATILVLKIARRWAAIRSTTIPAPKGTASYRNVFCTNCGAAQQDGGQFCGECGARRGE